MRNTSLSFGFLTRNVSLGELCILHIQRCWEMFFRRIVKIYSADLILQTKFKKIISMKEKFAQWRYKFYLWNFYSKQKEALMDFFV